MTTTTTNTDPPHYFQPLASRVFNSPNLETSLDPTETNPHAEEPHPFSDPDVDEAPGDLPSTPETTWRHSSWRHRRDATYASMLRNAASPGRLARFRDCGTSAWIMRCTDPATGKPRYRVSANTCHDRLCEACQRERRTTAVKNLAKATKGRTLRLLTLTLRGQATQLRQQLRRLYAAFSRLRRRREIAKSLRGGVAVLELTVNETTQLWHPHLHVIFEGAFLPQRVASRHWHDVTGDSFIVDVRALRTHQYAIAYVAKYATKALPTSIWRSPNHLDEAVEALRGVRALNTFGTWRGVKLRERHDTEDVWEPLGRLDFFLHQARLGDPEARAILAALRHEVTLERPDPHNPHTAPT